MKSVETRKKQLLARRADLIRRMDSIESELDAHDEKDWEELAIEREGDEVLEDLGQSAQSPSGRQTADKYARIFGMTLHANPITKNGAAGKGARRIDSQNTDRFAVSAKLGDQTIT